MKKTTGLVLLAAVLLTAGCYGSFSLSRKVWKWNGDTTKDKWGQEALFLAMCIVPVYEVVGIADAIVLNAMEFWGEKNPVTAKTTKSLNDGNQSAVLNWMPAENRLRIDIFENNRPKGWVVMAKDKAGDLYATDSNGTRLNSRTNADKSITLFTRDGKTVANYKPEDVNKYLN
ncbi:MAG: DUF3332 family protein [Elusimicrobiota bacterium]|nr:DUF3332 family protein [Elusimicrobiota bacterium]